MKRKIYTVALILVIVVILFCLFWFFGIRMEDVKDSKGVVAVTDSKGEVIHTAKERTDENR